MKKSPKDEQGQLSALILLVDDYADGREMYADALTFGGFRVIDVCFGRRRRLPIAMGDNVVRGIDRVDL
jgi:hypothetical protein